MQKSDRGEYNAYSGTFLAHFKNPKQYFDPWRLRVVWIVMFNCINLGNEMLVEMLL